MAAARSVLKDLPFSLARASLAFRRLNDHTLRAVGLAAQPVGMASVLHALDDEGDCTVSDLVARTQVANGTLTGLLDTLEQGGLIDRVENPDDGRSWIIRLSQKGRSLCAKLRTRHRTVMGIFGATLSATEAAELNRLLEKATRGMRAYVTAETSRTAAPRPGRQRKRSLPSALQPRRRRAARS